MVNFNPYMVYDPGKDAWRLAEPFSFHGYGVDLDIPAGFECDLASIPRFLWRIIAPFELSLAAPLVHDWLYRHGGRHLTGAINRLDADGIFREIMIAERVSRWRIWVAYNGVRLFGGRSWREGGACIQAG